MLIVLHWLVSISCVWTKSIQYQTGGLRLHLHNLQMQCRWHINPLTTVGYLLEVFIRPWIPSFIRISSGFYLELALETWVKALLAHSLRVHALGYTLTSECSIVRALRPDNAPPDKKLFKMQELESLQGTRSVFYTRLCKKAHTQHWPGLFFRQLQQPPCTVSQRSAPTHPVWYRRTHPPYRIAPTDNMQPKTDDAQRRQRLLNSYDPHSILLC